MRGVIARRPGFSPDLCPRAPPSPRLFSLRNYKIETFRELQARLPERIVEKAVWGMIPKGRLGRRQIHNLKVYAGPEHPHSAQQPVDITPLVGKKFADCDLSAVLEANGIPALAE